jgi:RimJ/RimL family protein N-acetyltransferase
MSSSTVPSVWPFHDLRVETGELELRLASFEDLVALSSLAFRGIHDPAVMPFGVPWTDASPEERARSTMQWHWRSWADLSPEQWHLSFVVVRDDAVVGTQELAAKKFAVRREVHTGSWLGRDYQGRGIGTQMRAAVLHLAFSELGALWATTAAFDDNPSSLGVTRRLGYQPDGMEVFERRGAPATLLRYRLSQADWQQSQRLDVAVSGLEACRSLLGAA